MSILTGYSRIPNGSDSFNSIPNGKDRTLEFLNALKSRQMQAQQRANGHVARQKLQKQSLLERHAVFTASAKQISAELATTCAKLESLANLARHRSLFDDRSEELEALTQKVRADITAINRQIAELQKAAKTNYSTASQSNMIKHSNTVLVSLQSKLASISTDFKNVLEQRTQTLKEQKQRREQFSGGLSSSNSSGAASVLLDSMRPGAPSLVLRRNNTAAPPNGLLAPPKSLLYSTEEEERSAGKNKSSTHSSPSHSRSPSSALTSGSHSIDLDSGSDSGYISSGNGNGSGSFRQQVMLVEQQDAYVASRAATMERIESTIVELGGIFQQLATMVSEQEEAVVRIDANVDETAMHVEAAHTELLRHLRSISSNRWLIAKVFGVLLIFFILFVVFFL